MTDGNLSNRLFPLSRPRRGGKAFFTISALLAFLLTAYPARALEQVSWSRLPYYLAARGLEPDQRLSLIDAPKGLNPETPSHHVMQVIANTFYEWLEYDFENRDGVVYQALVMLEPEKKSLSATEARILLTAASGRRSKKTTHPSEPQTISHPTSGQARVPGQTALRLAFYTDDPRVKVPPELVSGYPYNTIAFLDILDRGVFYRGTGFLAAPYCVLTAGHNLWWEDHVMDEISVIPALHTHPEDSGTLVSPYGEQSSRDFYSDPAFIIETDYNNPSEFDYGAVRLNRVFNQIATFIPLEFRRPFDPLPETITIPGYPAQVHGSSSYTYDMWTDTGRINGPPYGPNRQLVDFSAYISGGNSGSPILYETGNGQFRVIGIVTFQQLFYDTGVLLTSRNEDRIRQWLQMSPGHDYRYSYYIPYFQNTSTTSGDWSGLGLANPNPDPNHLLVEYFDNGGRPAGRRLLDLPGHGQETIICQLDDPLDRGWIRISSTLPCAGLALVGGTSPSTMFDIDLQPHLHPKFIFPHLAADDFWDATAMLCNPNRETARLTFTYRDDNGQALPPASLDLKPWASLAVDLEELFSRPLTGGSMLLESSQPLAAFLLYDGTETGCEQWKAGLSAIPLEQP